MQARYYDPLIGRFLSIDPVGFSVGAPQIFNRFSYVGNNPVNAIDPFGMVEREVKRTYTETGSRLKQTATITVEAGGLSQGETEAALSEVDTAFFRNNDGENLSSYQKNVGGDSLGHDEIGVGLQVLGRAVDIYGSDNLKEAWNQATDLQVDRSRKIGARASAHAAGNGWTYFWGAFTWSPDAWGHYGLINTGSHELFHNTYPYWGEWQDLGTYENSWALHDRVDAASRQFLRGAGIIK